MWIILAVTSYLISACVYIADKFLLSKKFHSSIVYAFFVCVWSIFNFLILFLDPWTPSLQQLSLDILAGLLFLITLIFWYKALHQSDTTRVVPLVGAMTPIFSFLLSYIFLGIALNKNQVIAFIILIIGGILISVRNTRFYAFYDIKERIKSLFGNMFGFVHAKYRPTRRLFLNCISASMLFASYFVLIKYIYSTQPFIGGFVWSRFGSFIGALLMLLVPNWRKLIQESKTKKVSHQNISFFLGIRISAAIAFILLNWAISLGNVAIINSLNGVQYVFLILIVLFLSAKYPKISKEEFGKGVMLQKVMGILLVCIGLYMVSMA